MADETPPPPKRIYLQRGIYKPKNGLDGFLRFTIGGKYKHKRYKILTDYLIIDQKYTPEKAAEIIAKYQANGVSLGVYQVFQDELRRWMQIRRKERSTKANKARWKDKRPKISTPENK